MIDEQVEVAEAPGSEHVLERLAGEPAGDHVIDEGNAPIGCPLVQADEPLSTAPSRCPLDDAPGLDCVTEPRQRVAIEDPPTPLSHLRPLAGGSVRRP